MSNGWIWTVDFDDAGSLPGENEILAGKLQDTYDDLLVLLAQVGETTETPWPVKTLRGVRQRSPGTDSEPATDYGRRVSRLRASN